MLIGLDFDNTIVNYEGVFRRWAQEHGLPGEVVQAGKTAIRDWLRSQGREEEWTILQGEVYGARMAEAVEAKGAEEFAQMAAQAGHRLVVISHRSLNPYLGPVIDLHKAARAWWEGRSMAKNIGSIYFETTADAKAERIRLTGCNVFVDDLWEFLERPDLPHTTRKIWLTTGASKAGRKGLERAGSWEEVGKLLLP